MDRIAKNAKISALIVGLMNKGATPQEALDAVLGEGTYDRMVGELYDELRAKAAR